MSDDAKRFYERAGLHECPVDPMMKLAAHPFLTHQLNLIQAALGVTVGPCEPVWKIGQRLREHNKKS